MCKDPQNQLQSFNGPKNERLIAVASSDSRKTSSKIIGKSSIWFILTAASILLATGLLKIFSASGKAELLSLVDPIFGISFRSLFLLVGLLELVISGVCLITIKKDLSLGLIAWLATSFLIYRFGIKFVGWVQPCPCMGNFADVIHISARSAEVLSTSILIFLLTGSYWLLGIATFKPSET